MGQVLIRNLDDETIAAYREAAVRHDRSLEAELREVLRQFRPVTAERREQAQVRMADIRAMTPSVPQTPSEMLVREDRDGYRGT
jgi:plasmid stability protein